MASTLTIPKSALDKYIPIKLISQSASGHIIASIRKTATTPMVSSLLALKIPPPNQRREALLGQIESLSDVNTRRLSRVIDYDTRGIWYITNFYHGQNLQHLKETLFQDGFPPFLVCKIFLEVMAAQGIELEPKGICHADLRASSIILSPTTKEEVPIVRIVHLEGIAVWNEQAIVRQMMELLRYLTNGVSRMSDDLRTNKKGEKLEYLIEDDDTDSLKIGDEFYSFIASYHLREKMSWEDFKSMWVNEAASLMKELYDVARLADVKEAIGGQKVTIEELRQVVEEGGMNVIEDRNL